MNKNLTRLLALFLAVCLGLCAIPAHAATINNGVVEEDGDISIPIGPDDGKEDPPAEFVAQGFCGEDAIWILNDVGLLTISGNGVMFDYTAAKSAPWYTYRDEIKAVIVDGSVSCVSAGAFYNCANLETVSLGAAVTAVESTAFAGCDALTGIWVEKSNTVFVSDADGVLYSKDMTTLVRCPTGYTGTLAIGANVSRISEGAFLDCQKLTAFQVAADNTSYASDSRGVLFNKAMTTLLRAPQPLASHYLIPETVAEVAPDAFADCAKLTGITIQAGVTQIGEGAFDRCTALAQVRYCSSQTQWEQIAIGSRNEPLTGAEFVYDAQPYLPGDYDLSGDVNDQDALYLLRNTLFPNRYPIVMSGDVNGDGDVNDQDALYLLRHTLFPTRYPLH